MLFNEYINLFATLPIIANFNRMAVMTKMNASPLTCVISMDVEDPSTAQCDTLGGHLAYLTTRVDLEGGGPPTEKGSLVTPSNFVLLFEEVR